MYIHLSNETIERLLNVCRGFQNDAVLQQLATDLKGRQADANDPEFEKYRDAAKERYAISDEECTIDEDATVSVSDDNGAWVHAWLWVDDANAGISRDSDEESASR